MNERASFLKYHSVTLILPYFGILPNYFSLWIKSAHKCENISFLVCGDNLPQEGQDKNIHFVCKSFEWIKQRIDTVLGFKCTLNKPYKLCDYKPAYGLIFSEYLTHTEYWGYCDPDLIFGTKVEECIQEAIAQNSDKIYKYGHLTLYRNNTVINSVFMKHSQVEKITYRDVYSMNYVAHFDEGYIIRDLFKDYKVYDRNDFSDISFWKYCFSSSGYENFKQIYEYNDGQLILHYIDEYGEHRTIERIYIHLQKRKMELDNEIGSRFLIVPNRFIRIGFDYSVTKDIIEKYSVDNESYRYSVKKRRVKAIIEHCLSGALKYRMINCFRKD